jgi:hypothetical protein
MTAWRFQYDEITFVAPTFRAQYDGLWSKLDPAGITVKESLTEDWLLEYFNKVSTDPKPRLLVLDDLGDELRKISPRVINLLVSNSRHYNLSVIALHQRLTQCPTIVRAQADCIIAFAACAYTEVELLHRMVSTVPRSQFQAMFMAATLTPHSFLVSVVDKGGRLRFYHKDFKTEIKPPSSGLLIRKINQ